MLHHEGDMRIITPHDSHELFLTAGRFFVSEIVDVETLDATLPGIAERYRLPSDAPSPPPALVPDPRTRREWTVEEKNRRIIGVDASDIPELTRDPLNIIILHTPSGRLTEEMRLSGRVTTSPPDKLTTTANDKYPDTDEGLHIDKGEMMPREGIMHGPATRGLSILSHNTSSRDIHTSRELRQAYQEGEFLGSVYGIAIPPGWRYRFWAVSNGHDGTTLLDLDPEEAVASVQRSLQRPFDYAYHPNELSAVRFNGIAI